MFVLIPLLAVLTALEGRLPDERGTTLGPLVGAVTGRPAGPRVGALAGALFGDQLENQHATKAERAVVTVGSMTTVANAEPLTVSAVGRELDKRPVAKPDPDAVYAAELLDILNTTKSPQTYLLTLMLLGESKAEPKRVIPVAIRSAERLGIFGKKPIPAPDGPDELTGIVADLIRKLAARDRASTAKPVRPEGEPPARTTIGQIVPVQPWQAERLDEKFKPASPGRVPIFPPVREGFPNPIDCCDEPTDREVLAALPAAAKGIPAVYTETRDNFRIVKELESEKLDALRFYPLVGPARAHVGTWKCTVRFTETIASDYPFPVKVSRDRTEVVRVRTTHLHVAEPQTGPATRDLTTDPAPRP